MRAEELDAHGGGLVGGDAELGLEELVDVALQGRPDAGVARVQGVVQVCTERAARATKNRISYIYIVIDSSNRPGVRPGLRASDRRLPRRTQSKGEFAAMEGGSGFGAPDPAVVMQLGVPRAHVRLRRGVRRARVRCTCSTPDVAREQIRQQDGVKVRVRAAAV